MNLVVAIDGMLSSKCLF